MHVIKVPFILHEEKAPVVYASRAANVLGKLPMGEKAQALSLNKINHPSSRRNKGISRASDDLKLSRLKIFKHTPSSSFCL
jgi:hypothetical protein